MYARATISTGHDLHRTVTPGASDDPLRAAASFGKERSMPTEQPLATKFCSEIMGDVEHHFNDTFNRTIIGWKPVAANAQPPREQGPHLISIEFHPFNFT